jgi:hypothetical protein
MCQIKVSTPYITFASKMVSALARASAASADVAVLASHENSHGFKSGTGLKVSLQYRHHYDNAIMLIRYI